MTRHRRRGLGSSVAVHERKRAEAAQGVRRATQAMHDSLRVGDCKRAVQQWAGGAQAWGEFRAHHQAAGGEMGDAGISTMNNAYHAQRDRVLAACVRPNAISDAGRVPMGRPRRRGRTR